VIASGNILKMKSTLGEVVEYKLPIGDELLLMNQFLEKKIRLEFTGEINCIHSGKKIKKSYGQGFSYESFMKLAACDMCIIKPELCHFDKGTCREPEWGKKNCFAPHVIYLSDTSSIKVGITRKSQVPTRWIDQGATRAIPLIEVDNRMISGQVEVELKSMFNDKTNWRNMLKGLSSDVDLEEQKEIVFEEFAELFDDMGAEEIEESVIDINYPVVEYPTKITSLGFDKNSKIEGTLLGIKGQYLIFDSGVINLRKHQGYKINISVN
jgi:hypothetical protein